MKFLNELHKKRFNELIKKVVKKDRKRVALCYLLSSYSIYCKADILYDFKNDKLNIECPYYFSTSQQVIRNIVYSIFSNTNRLDIKTYGELCCLDRENKEIIAETIRLRYVEEF